MKMLIFTYLFAKNEFHEIDTTDFVQYVYIIIQETYKYFNKDYVNY